ncbi:hypothetical protein I4U23_010659 [Adineta vaga]|nr:hypothetical protein I4U23_010659 [Adineta vaga]
MASCGQNPIVNYLTAKQACDYMAEVKKNENLFTLIRESFQLKMDITKGVTKDEMNEVVSAATDPDLKNALQNIRLVGDSKTVLTLDNSNRAKYRKALVVYGRRSDGKYDVLVVYATQVKELAVDKLVACGLGSICAGIVAGVVTMNPVVGVSTVALLSAGSGAKAAYDYTQEMPDVLCGYILEELVQKRVLQIQPNQSVQFAIS